MYKRFGKVSEVDGSGDPIEVFRMTRKAMLPQVSWMIGPKVSGKTELGRRLAERTNAKHFPFLDWCKEKGFNAAHSDEQIVHALINQLSLEIAPTVIIEDFPQNAQQAKFFISNSVTPSIVIQLNCSYDTSQERMLCMDQKHPNYMASALLSKSIADYNSKLPELLSELDKVPSLRIISIDTEQPLENSFKEICALVEPTIITVRTSGSDAANEAKERIQNEMIQKGFIGLDVNELIKTFNDRGIEIDEKREGAYLITAILRKIIYNGESNRN